MVIGLNISTTTSAAFGEDPRFETARILRVAADKVEAQGIGWDHIHLHDINGNRVGDISASGLD